MLRRSFSRGVQSYRSVQTRLARSDAALSHSRVLSSDAKFQRADVFLQRHIGVNASDQQQMLDKLGFSSINDLLDVTVPSEIRLKQPLDLPEGLSESEATEQLKAIASKNAKTKSFIGMGYYDSLTPAPIQRLILESPGWYTSYTPYQPEIAQGRLEMLLNFQTMVMELTGMAVANASLLDEASAAAEAITLSHNNSNGKRPRFFVANDVHPQTLGVMQTRAEFLNVELIVGDPLNDLPLGSDDAKSFSGVMLQYPNTFGEIRDYRDFVDNAHKDGLMVGVAADLMSLTQLVPPGELGADFTVGSAQRFGVPMMFGGPHAAYMATTHKHHRKLPGRIIGVSRDARGEPALRMAMQTREQHIRRDKATSNICTAQALLANMAAAYAIYHGPEGISRIAKRIHFFTSLLAVGIEKETKCQLRNSFFYDTLDVDVSGAGVSSDEVLKRGGDLGVNLRRIDDQRVGISMGESADVEDLVNILKSLGADVSADTVKSWDAEAEKQQHEAIPDALRRHSQYLTHGIFNKYHSETELMRYLKHLEDKDLGLNRSMISLGSCTMKLNAVSELQPISWPEFTNVHPFAPEEQTEGYREMIESLNKTLAEITGFSAVSTQPNSGAQGEYSGLLAIRNYQKAQGQGHRKVCLIPISAHGTNPASAVMAGMKVVVVKSDENGHVDRDDLKEKVEKYADDLSAFMITYPSTYGVFEEGITEMCELIHSHGGQVYMDGANMNAQVGLTNPGNIGADVCHLNLHKTFCIPHGGGGPGVGSIGVASHLAPHLPGHVVAPCGGEGDNTVAKSEYAVSAAPFGSAGILPISWMYIHMLGEQGLKLASSNAILNANYMAKRLESSYEILYRGRGGTCGHEFIINVKPFKDVDISEEDIAKRLQDFGFHSPTMSFPKSGTLMVEPTESESKAEMDRLCEALEVIREEIEDIRSGKVPAADSPLKHAPHTADMVTAEHWDRPYSRQQAAFPASWQKGGVNKGYWPSVARVDNVHGDRNLICSCPPLEAYE